MLTKPLQQPSLPEASPNHQRLTVYQPVFNYQQSSAILNPNHLTIDQLGLQDFHLLDPLMTFDDLKQQCWASAQREATERLGGTNSPTFSWVSCTS